MNPAIRFVLIFFAACAIAGFLKIATVYVHASPRLSHFNNRLQHWVDTNAVQLSSHKRRRHAP
jgi:hypothetical protein